MVLFEDEDDLFGLFLADTDVPNEPSTFDVNVVDNGNGRNPGLASSRGYYAQNNNQIDFNNTQINQFGHRGSGGFDAGGHGNANGNMNEEADIFDSLDLMWTDPLLSAEVGSSSFLNTFGNNNNNVVNNENSGFNSAFVGNLAGNGNYGWRERGTEFRPISSATVVSKGSNESENILQENHFGSLFSNDYPGKMRSLHRRHPNVQMQQPSNVQANSVTYNATGHYNPSKTGNWFVDDPFLVKQELPFDDFKFNGDQAAQNLAATVADGFSVSYDDRSGSSNSEAIHGSAKGNNVKSPKGSKKAAKSVKKTHSLSAHVASEHFSLEKGSLPLSEREKNREAVRNCRKRKREQAVQLHHRIEKLRQENEVLKFQLRFGTRELEHQLNDKENIILKQMKDIVGPNANAQISNKAPSQNGYSPSTNARLRQVLDVYLKGKEDLSKNAKASLYFLLSRLQTQTLPSNYTKMYFWQNAQNDDFFKKPDGLWQEMVRVLKMSDSQQQLLMARRFNVTETCKEIGRAIFQMHRLSIIIHQTSEASLENIVLRTMDSILSSRQMTQWLVLVHDYLSSNLNSTNQDFNYEKLLLKYDPEIDQGIRDGSPDVTIDVDPETLSDKLKLLRNPHSTDDDKAVFLLKTRRRTVMQLQKIFESDEDENALRLSLQKLLSQDVELFDPNFRQPVRGMRAVTTFFRKFKSAFLNLKAELQEITLKKRANIGKSTWLVSGFYKGSQSLDVYRSSTDVINSVPLTNRSLPVPKKVEFKILLGVKFEADAERISQVVISWAALDLMKQLGLLSETFMKNNSLYFKSEDGEPAAKLSLKQMQEKCLEFCKIFQVTTSVERNQITAKLLEEKVSVIDSNMGGHFKGRDNVVKYVEKMRKPFKKLALNKHNFIPIKQPAAPPAVANTKQALLVKVHMGCLLEGIYEGALVKEPKPFSFSAELFFTVNPISGLINDVTLNFDATSLMNEIGLM